METKSKYIWINGKFVDYAKAQVHVLNHSLHYGSAVFDGMRCYSTQNGPAIFRLKDHVDRLFHSAEVMSINVPFTKKQVFAATLELIKKK